MNKLIIQYYRRNIYGRELLFIKDLKQRELIQNLTRCKSIDEVHMKSLSALCNNQIEWQEVLPA